MRNKRLLLIGGVLLCGVGALVVSRAARDQDGRYATVAVERGDVLETVGATGTLQAVTTVQVGSQVSGNIMSLGADFNSRVTRGQVIARLEPSTYEARVAQMQANLTAAVANAERSQAALEDARQKFERARELSAEQLLARSEYETAEANHDGAVAQLKASQAAVAQARANLSQAEVDLRHTVITAPIDGVVIARNVDVGQTVAASFQAPVLFVIANDLTHMQVSAAIDEADIGRVRSGQDVTFRVDAFPERTFEGRIEQVRLQPVTEQNVVTYNTIISAENPRQLLMPGMTATVSVVSARREAVLRVPAAALRFRPEGYEEAPGARMAGAGRRGASGEAGAASGGESGRRRGRGGRAGRGPAAAGDAPQAGTPPAEGGDRGASADAGDDARRREGRGRPGLVFVLDAAGKPQPTQVRLGISDGRYVEVRDGLVEGAQVIIGDASAAVARPAGGASPGANPFSPSRPQPRAR